MNRPTCACCPPVRPSASEPEEPVARSFPLVLPSDYPKPPAAVLRSGPPDPGGTLPRDPALPSSCTATPLPTGTAKSVAVNGGDPAGTYLVGWTEPVAGGKHDVLVWRDGELIDRVEQSRAMPVMQDINSAGLAVGAIDGYAPTPYYYRDGKVRELRGAGEAIAVNEAGTIAGYWEKAARSWPQRWSSYRAEPELMPVVEDAWNGHAKDIDENGTVLVGLSLNGVREHSYLWFTDGTVQRLVQPEETVEAGLAFQAVAFRFGWVYGWMEWSGSNRESMPVGFTPLAYRYEPNTGTWQKVNDPTGTGQIPPGGARSLQAEPVAIIGRETLPLSRVATKREGTSLTFISEDGRTMAGTTISQAAKVNHPAAPTIWRCK